MKNNAFYKIVLLIVLLAVVGAIAVFLSGCNKQVFDTTYTFNYAIIELPGGEIVEGKVDSWTDYENGDQIQVKIEGKTYLVHSSDIALIHK